MGYCWVWQSPKNGPNHLFLCQYPCFKEWVRLFCDFQPWLLYTGTGSMYVLIHRVSLSQYAMQFIVDIHIVFSSTKLEIFVHSNMLCGFWLTYNKWVQVGNWTIHIRCIIYRNRPHCWKKYCKVKYLACFILPNSYLGVNWWSNKVIK